MNERGVEALVAAAMRGQPQGHGAYITAEGLCAFGVLAQALGWSTTAEIDRSFVLLARAYEIDMQQPRICPECGKETSSEGILIVHLNDSHQFDWLTIARKLGPDAA